MPGLDGMATARRLRSDPLTSRARIVLISARTRPADLEQGADAGADEYVIKPFDPDDVVDAVRRLADAAGQLSGARAPLAQHLLHRHDLVLLRGDDRAGHRRARTAPWRARRRTAPSAGRPRGGGSSAAGSRRPSPCRAARAAWPARPGSPSRASAGRARSCASIQDICGMSDWPVCPHASSQPRIWPIWASCPVSMSNASSRTAGSVLLSRTTWPSARPGRGGWPCPGRTRRRPSRRAGGRSVADAGERRSAPHRHRAARRRRPRRARRAATAAGG